MFYRFWRKFLAFMRWSNKAICEESRGLDDYHDYQDSIEKQQMHFYRYTCIRCGKKFFI